MTMSSRVASAERVGFEPTVRVNGLRFSRPVPSTTQPPLHICLRAKEEYQNTIVRYNVAMQRLLGIDYGAKRIGIAVSDESRTIAVPHSVVANTKSAVEDIAAICKKEDIAAVVVGESKDFKGNDNEIMEAINAFTEELKGAASLDIELEPEFLTSVEAAKMQGHNEMHDASAAALILQRHLDKKKHE